MSAQNQQPDPQDAEIAAKGRMVSLVIAGTMIVWILSWWVGPMLGLPGRYALLFDFGALAGFFWALVVALQIRRARQNARGNE